MTIPLSILDLAAVERGQSVRDALTATVELARRAETLGYERIWYAEHHNMGQIASSATSVLIAHVAASTETIRLGAGGIMLPNHSPLVIAEQFGTLAELHPNRIDLGLGRAPGTDQITMRALRRDHTSADTFPRDVQELQGFLGDESIVPGVKAVPGKGTHVPLWILGSSLFGASLAAALGLPYGFASHFAPEMLADAVALYRARFQPSAQLAEPKVLAGVNVIAADSTEDAQRQAEVAKRQRVASFIGRGRKERFTEEEIDVLLESPQGRGITAMFRYLAVGTRDEVRNYLDDFASMADADELMVVFSSPTFSERMRSMELTVPSE